jgi:hypothetical protein
LRIWVQPGPHSETLSSKKEKKKKKRKKERKKKKSSSLQLKIASISWLAYEGTKFNDHVSN